MQRAFSWRFCYAVVWMIKAWLWRAGEPAMGKRPQFSLRNVMVAVIWLSLWIAWGAVGEKLVGPPPVSYGASVLLFAFLLGPLTLGLPVVAICALFGRTQRGLCIMALMVPVLLILAAISSLVTNFP
jgi:hypothetical protein